MPTIERDRFEGCLLGLALGDALGAPREGGPLERLLWRAIGRTSKGETRWTDDTQMSLDLADSLIACSELDPDDLAKRFAAGYTWSRGYGPSAAKVLKRIARGEDWRRANRSVHPDGSFGNGGAMRAPVVGLFFADRPGEVAEAARKQARVTHCHPLGEEGAVLVAVATAHAALGETPLAVMAAAQEACDREPFQARLERAQRWLEAGTSPSASEVRAELGNGIAATDSCVSALFVALHHLDKPFLALLAFIEEMGGDVDTLGSMSGAIWGAANGAAKLPQAELARLEQRERLARASVDLHARSLARALPEELEVVVAKARAPRETRFKLGHLVGDDWVEHSHPATFTILDQGERGSRVIAGVPGSDPRLMVRLAECLEEPYFLLYVLHVPRAGPEEGRYQSPELSRGHVESFIEEFEPFLRTDARFDLWLYSPAEEATLVWDCHNLLHAYGPLDRYAERLKEMGFEDGDPVVPVPHAHHYHQEMDAMAEHLIQKFPWHRTPLMESDHH